MTPAALPDPRRNAYRRDLAAELLRGLVEAERYVRGEPRQVGIPVLPLRREPRFDATLDTEILLGETVSVYDESEGWAWVQSARDGYVGYMPSEGLTPQHRRRLRTASRPCAHMSIPSPTPRRRRSALLSLNAFVTVAEPGGKFHALAGGGYVFAGHAVPVGDTARDYVAVAESFLGTPYLWGGRTSIGLDCSGLVQLSLEAAGHAAPRDADMQAAELGHAIDWRKDKLRRGDLVFWDGHVGIMTSETDFLHANAFHMAVEAEPFARARKRIKDVGYEVTCVRRLPGPKPPRRKAR